jgi:hypothetical protein
MTGTIAETAVWPSAEVIWKWFVDHAWQLSAYCVEKLDVEVGDSGTLSSKRALHSG